MKELIENGKIIKRQRLFKGLTQQNVCDFVELKIYEYSGVEQGNRKISYDKWLSIIDLLGIDNYEKDIILRNLEKAETLKKEKIILTNSQYLKMIEDLEKQKELTEQYRNKYNKLKNKLKNFVNSIDKFE